MTMDAKGLDSLRHYKVQRWSIADRQAKVVEKTEIEDLETNGSNLPPFESPLPKKKSPQNTKVTPGGGKRNPKNPTAPKKQQNRESPQAPITEKQQSEISQQKMQGYFQFSQMFEQAF